ncbi:MAG: hypothetical protein IJ132_03865 [Firmicutes bacterium]|nr:hypothetical protein [Bacillota bacterium]
MKRITISERLFTGKKDVPWDEVEKYLKRYINQTVKVNSTNDIIRIPKDYPDEYSGSQYTKKLRGAVAKAKANIIVELLQLIQNASNRRHVANKTEKHEKDASRGWYRYDICLGILVRGENERDLRENIYKGTLVVRRNERGNELYDIVNIKKEASKPLKP